MNVLVLNAGSNSLKFEIVDAKPDEAAGEIQFGRSLVSGAYDDIGKESAAFRLLAADSSDKKEKVEVRDHGHATKLLVDWIQNGGARAQSIVSLSEIARVGHRVVHGGS